MQLSAICNDIMILSAISVNYSSWSAVFMNVHLSSPDKIVCIFAAGHSGSTLVSLMLGAHSHVFYAGEFHALPNWINEKKNCGCGRSIHDCNFWQKVNREYDKVDFFLYPKQLPVYLRFKNSAFERFMWKTQKALTYHSIVNPFFSPLKRIHMSSWKNMVESTVDIFRIISGLTDKSIIVDSTKDYQRMYHLYKAFPGSVKIVFLTRDGRAVCHSNIKKKQYSMKDAALQWKNSYARAEKIFSNIPEEVFFRLRYEDLCENPLLVGGNLARFLDIDFEPQMLKLDVGVEHSIAGNNMKWMQNNTIEINEKWKKELLSTELQQFENIAGDMNHHYGYPRPNDLLKL